MKTKVVVAETETVTVTDTDTFGSQLLSKTFDIFIDLFYSTMFFSTVSVYMYKYFIATNNRCKCKQKLDLLQTDDYDCDVTIVLYYVLW